MDQQLGDVLDSLAKHGYADDTLFMYTADQGAVVVCQVECV
jgi:arylsulfatase A-like enzyme